VSSRYNRLGKPKEKRFISVVVGAHNLTAKSKEPSQKRHRVKMFWTHPLYPSDRSASPYDIALIELKTSIQFNEATRPICVDDSVFQHGTSCYVTGWGVIEVKEDKLTLSN